jgi:hypothetical protein
MQTQYSRHNGTVFCRLGGNNNNSVEPCAQGRSASSQPDECTQPRRALPGLAELAGQNCHMQNNACFATALPSAPYARRAEKDFQLAGLNAFLRLSGDTTQQRSAVLDAPAPAYRLHRFHVPLRAAADLRAPCQLSDSVFALPCAICLDH